MRDDAAQKKAAQEAALTELSVALAAQLEPVDRRGEEHAAELQRAELERSEPEPVASKPDAPM